MTDEIREKWKKMSDRERDAWVAEVVMGMDVVEKEGRYYERKITDEHDPYQPVGDFLVPPYTTDWGAAGEVVEEMENEDYSIKLTHLDSIGSYQARYRRDTEIVSLAVCYTAPEAICLAAIMAKEGDK